MKLGDVLSGFFFFFFFVAVFDYCVTSLHVYE